MSNRRRLRAAYLKKRDKRILALNRERKKLWQAQWHAPLIELDEPYQQGWIRTYAYHDDVLTRKDADILLLILEKINVRQWSRRADFKKRNWNKQWIEQSMNTGKLSHRSWKKLGFTEAYKKYFYCKYNCSRNGWWHPKYNFKYEWMLNVVLIPRMITHQKAILPEVERRLAEIEAEFERNGYDFRLDNLKGRRGWRWYDKRGRNYSRSVKKSCIEQEIRKYLEEEFLDPTESEDPSTFTKEVDRNRRDLT